MFRMTKILIQGHYDLVETSSVTFKS